MNGFTIFDVSHCHERRYEACVKWNTESVGWEGDHDSLQMDRLKSRRMQLEIGEFKLTKNWNVSELRLF